MAIIAEDPTVTEGNPDNSSTLTFTLDRFGGLEQTDTIEVEVIAPGDNPAGASDLVDGFSSSQVTFEVGEDSKAIDISISPDLIFEENETFGVRVISVSGSASVPSDDTIFTILNDDLNLLDTTLNRFQNEDVPGTFLFATEQESQSIRQNFSNLVEEGIAFYTYGANSNQADPFNRFQNSDRRGTYLFAGEEESRSIRANFPSFVEEGIAFEARII